jgi:hypothetical protein
MLHCGIRIGWPCVKSHAGLRRELMNNVDERLEYEEMVIVLSDTCANEDDIKGCAL